MKLDSNLLFSVEYLRALPMSSLLDRLAGADGVVALFRLFRVSLTLLVRGGTADVDAETVTPADEGGFEVDELTVEFEPEKWRINIE